MKHAQGRANWSGKPSLSHLWMGSTLHTLAMLVSIVVKFFQMALRRRARECHAEPTPERLPRTNNDPINRETTPADPLGQSQEGLMVSSEIAQSANSRPSNHEAGLTNRGSSRNRAYLAIPLRQPRKSASATSPYRFATWGGKRGDRRGLSRWWGIASISRNATGGGGWSRLRDQTEGVSRSSETSTRA